MNLVNFKTIGCFSEIDFDYYYIDSLLVINKIVITNYFIGLFTNLITGIDCFINFNCAYAIKVIMATIMYYYFKIISSNITPIIE